MKKTFRLLWPFLLPLSPLTFAADCALSTDLVYHANELFNQRTSIEEQVAILTQAVEVCPGNIHAHNNLANQLGELRRFAEAIEHYRAALQIKPDFIDAWFGLGETYQAWGRFPQSLEAYLHICAQDKKAYEQVQALLKDNRFAMAETGEVLNREALLLLFDKEKLKEMVRACGMRVTIQLQPILRNFEFETGKATLENNSINTKQLEEISAALRQLAPERKIYLHGHSDDQPFSNVSQAESDRLNLQLSRERTETIRKFLLASGIAAQRLFAQGHGSSQPLSTERDRNRRVVIDVE